ncbi:MAG: IS630 family transposase [Treponema sp.]|nr:IS630 family transposase [Treponema sp.]
MSKAKKMTKNQIQQANDPQGNIVRFLIGFLTKFLPLTLCQRIAVIFFILADLPTKRICVLTGMSDKVVRKIGNDMKTLPLYSLLTIKKGSGRPCDLEKCEEQIKNELKTKNYFSRQQIADMIWEKFKVRISLSAVGKYLKKWGFKKLKAGSFPAKADPEKQASFYENTLHPLMEKAKNGTIALLFMDASHFVMGCDFLGYVYCLVRRFLATGSGRNRYNVLGALDFVTKKVLTITNEKYINAVAVCDLLKKIADEYKGQIVHIILDNAKYQKCKLVTNLAAELGIILEYIPPYSPNLNLIERLWKFVKAQIRTVTYENFDEFKVAIDRTIDSTTKENKPKIDHLIGEKIQLFNLQKISSGTYEGVVPRSSQAA